VHAHFINICIVNIDFGLDLDLKSVDSHLELDQTCRIKVDSYRLCDISL